MVVVKEAKTIQIPIFNSSIMCHKLMTGSLNLPGTAEISFGPVLPHFMLADTIFGNRPYWIPPYPGNISFDCASAH